MSELLQRLHRAKFFTSLDLSSAYLQTELHEDSRKYTAFTLESKVYQFKRVPYGLKNSLSSFVRARKATLGGTDDILIHFPTVSDHLRQRQS
jgi:hypothetical protein